MKKVLSVILAIIIVASTASIAFAQDYVTPVYDHCNYPVIFIAGDSRVIVDEDQNQVFKFADVLTMFQSGGDGSVSDAAMNIIKPFVLEGILTDNWDNYYDAIYKEINDVFEDAKLDNNGEATNGTGIRQSDKDENAREMTHLTRNSDGTFRRNSYWFYYDWRLDPLATADELNTFIEAVKKVTGFDKICVLCHCLGSNILLSYISKYGTDSLHGVGIGGSVSMGSEPIGEALSGNFEVDGYGIRRFLDDCEKYGVFESFSDEVNIIIDYAIDSGLITGVTDLVRDTIYAKVEKGVTSALALSTFFTWPGYWATVGAENYEDALLYVFGEEGSEKRTEYAGLIEKIENYRYQVSEKVPELLLSLGENGVNVAIVSKYGSQIVPICESNDQISDQFGSVKNSSFGATTASSIFDTLTDEYIAEQTEKGLGKYISPDKQIDASTCLYPDSTFFIKNARHSTFSHEEDAIMMTIMGADHQLTVDDFEVSQFIVADNPSGGDEDVHLTKMTEENCHTESWYEEDDNGDPNTSFLDKIKNWFRSTFKFFMLIIDKLAAKIDAADAAKAAEAASTAQA